MIHCEFFEKTTHETKLYSPDIYSPFDIHPSADILKIISLLIIRKKHTFQKQTWIYTLLCNTFITNLNLTEFNLLRLVQKTSKKKKIDI